MMVAWKIKEAGSLMTVELYQAWIFSILLTEIHTDSTSKQIHTHTSMNTHTHTIIAITLSKPEQPTF